MDTLATADIFLFEGFRLDWRGGALFRTDEHGGFVPVAIGSRALEILGKLVEQAGDLVSKDELIAAVWPGTVVEDSNLTVQISALRRILDDRRSDGSFIQTIPGRGYRFAKAVTRVQANAHLGAAANTEGADPTNGNAGAQFPAAPTSTPTSADLPRRALHSIFAALVVLGIIGLAIALGSRWHWSAGTLPRLSMVVLPLTNLGNDPDQDYFVDAITDDVTTDLSRIAGGAL